jgi:hypothetical protein
MTHVWRIRKWLGGRHGQACRVLARGRNGSILVEFEDGFKAVTPRFSVRRTEPRTGGGG